MHTTYLRQLVERTLPEPLEGWVVERRVAGMSWRRIAEALNAELGWQLEPASDPGSNRPVGLHAETLRKWFGPHLENTEVSP
jgi:hypothetical protein